jgi:RHS repeat-associated protein
MTDWPAGQSLQRYSYLYDPGSSVSLLINWAGVQEESYGYNAYGDPNNDLSKKADGFSTAPVPTNPVRFQGKRFDSGSGTYDMGARRYSPSTGRWLQQDVYADALDNLGLSQDPLTANRYAFLGANPVNYVELDGHSFWSKMRDLYHGFKWIRDPNSAPHIVQGDYEIFHVLFSAAYDMTPVSMMQSAVRDWKKGNYLGAVFNTALAAGCMIPGGGEAEDVFAPSRAAVKAYERQIAEEGLPAAMKSLRSEVRLIAKHTRDWQRELKAGKKSADTWRDLRKHERNFNAILRALKKHHGQHLRKS